MVWFLVVKPATVFRWHRDLLRGQRPILEETNRDKYNVQSWMEGYIQAWWSAAEDIGSPFTAAALYYTAPYREPWRSRKNIIAGWRGRQDKPDEWEFRYEILGTVNNVAFVSGWTNYHREGIKVSNLWIIRFTEGQCDEFVEWWMEGR